MRLRCHLVPSPRRNRPKACLNASGPRDLRGNADQTACKPGSVPPAEAGAAIIPLGRALLRGSRDLPGRLGPATALPWREPRRAVPIWSCSRRGLPCRPCHQVRGALLPHPFTLTLLRRGFGGRFAFCGAIPGLAPGGRYPPPCRRGARTFLDPPCGGPRPPGRLIRGEHGPGPGPGQPRTNFWWQGNLDHTGAFGSLVKMYRAEGASVWVQPRRAP